MRGSQSPVPGWGARSAIVAIGLALSSFVAGCAAPSDTVGATVDSLYAQAEGIRPDQLENRQARDTAVFDWAIELGLGESFSRSDLERAYVDEMAARESGAASGSGAYGARAMTLWDFYVEQVERHEQLIKPRIRDELIMDEVREYYEQHRDEFKRQDIITVRVTEWADGRALSSDDVTIDETNVRMLQEGDDAVISAALDLEEGERATVERRDGTFAQLECLSRADGGFEPFDTVVQAAAIQLANQRFEVELQRRVDGAS